MRTRHPSVDTHVDCEAGGAALLAITLRPAATLLARRKSFAAWMTFEPPGWGRYSVSVMAGLRPGHRCLSWSFVLKRCKDVDARDNVNCKGVDRAASADRVAGSPATVGGPSRASLMRGSPRRLLPRSSAATLLNMNRSRRAQPRVIRASVLICPTGSAAVALSSPICKNISLSDCPKSILQPRPSHPHRGAYRDRHGRGVGCGGRGSVGAQWDRRAVSKP